ncbi:MAG: PaaI family thioesterase [Chloroflexota bacterium]|nr:PaaI family thioesterase [Chloroflexota bacterium]
MTEERVASLNAFAKDRHPGLVGVQVLTCGRDEVTGRLDVTHELVAGTGYLWAPVVVTLADWLCACGMGPNLPEGASFTTVELKANFVGTVREGGAVRGVARPVHRGRTTQVWDVEVTDEADGRPVALFRCTQMVLLPR